MLSELVQLDAKTQNFLRFYSVSRFAEGTKVRLSANCDQTAKHTAFGTIGKLLYLSARLLRTHSVDAAFTPKFSRKNIT